MAGYNGYSMSNNAVDAYNSGEIEFTCAIIVSVGKFEVSNDTNGIEIFNMLQISEINS